MVTILILIDGFLQFAVSTPLGMVHKKVTILILIDGFSAIKEQVNHTHGSLKSQSLF